MEIYWWMVTSLPMVNPTIYILWYFNRLFGHSSHWALNWTDLGPCHRSLGTLNRVTFYPKRESFSNFFFSCCTADTYYKAILHRKLHLLPRRLKARSSSIDTSGWGKRVACKERGTTSKLRATVTVVKRNGQLGKASSSIIVRSTTTFS